MTRSEGKAVLGRMPYGVYVVGAADGDGVASIVATWVVQVSFHPQLVSISIEADSDIRRSIETSGYFSVSVLPAGGRDIAKSFLKGKKALAKGTFSRKWSNARNGSPFWADALACMECKVVRQVETGDHLLFIGEVVDATSKRTGEALTLRETGWSYQK